MAKNDSQDRDRKRKTAKEIQAEANFEITLDDIEQTGSLPDNITMSKRHPGVLQQKSKRRKEFMLATVHSLRNRGYKIEQIAAALRISEAMVSWYIVEMKRYVEQDIASLTFRGYLGNSLVMYKDLQAKALRMIEGKIDRQMSDQNKLRALRDTAHFERGKLTVLKEAGFFKNAKLNPAPSGDSSEMKPIDVMKKLLNSLTVDPKTVGKEKPNTIENATFDPEKDARVLS